MSAGRWSPSWAPAALPRYAPAGGHGNAEFARDPFRPDADELEAWTVANQRARSAYYARFTSTGTVR